MNLDLESFYVGTLCFTLATGLLHVIGIILLFRIRNDFFNQITIMINLAVTETLYCINLSTVFICKIIMTEEKWDTMIHLKTFTLMFEMSTFTVNKLVVLYLILDRFLDIKLHMRYPLYFRRSTVISTLSLLWTFGAFYAFIQGALYNRKIIEARKAWRTHDFVSMTLDTIIILSAIITYSFFFYKTRTMLKNDNSQRATRCRINFNRHLFKFVVPFLILATYLIFNVTSSSLFLLRRFTDNVNTKAILLHIAWLVRVLGFFSDTLLHIFLQKDVRVFIKSKFRWRIQTNNATAATLEK